MALPLHELLHIDLCAQRVSLLDGDPYDGILLPFDGDLKLSTDFLPEALAAAHDADVDEHGYLTVGQIGATVFDHGAMLNRGEHPFDVFDSHSQGMHEFYCDIFKGSTDAFKDSVEEITEHGYVSRLLYVDALTVRPEFRGHQLGLAAVYGLMHSAVANCNTAALYATPFIEDDQGNRRDAKALQKGQKVLAKMYESIGFKKVRGVKNLMMVNLEYRKQPFPAAVK